MSQSMMVVHQRIAHPHIRYFHPHPHHVSMPQPHKQTSRVKKVVQRRPQVGRSGAPLKLGATRVLAHT